MDIENGLKTLVLNVGDKSVNCPDIIKWAEKWDWGVGEIVAKRLHSNAFKDWESIIALTNNEQYVGLCILEITDEWGTDIDPALTPFITAVYIDPQFRGQHLSAKLIGTACDYAFSLGFDIVYLISGEHGLYEKFGFEIYTQTVTRLGTVEPVYRRYLG